MGEKILGNETLVEIIGADKSDPVSSMYDLIGKRGKISEYSGDGHYKVMDWWWDPLDFKVIKEKEIEKIIFDTKNLVTGDSL